MICSFPLSYAEADTSRIDGGGPDLLQSNQLCNFFDYGALNRVQENEWKSTHSFASSLPLGSLKDPSGAKKVRWTKARGGMLYSSRLQSKKERPVTNAAYINVL
jgi:hypothetical protein